MYFVAMTLPLQAQDRRSLTTVDSIYAHAAILHAITDADPDMGSALHDMHRNKRTALSIVSDHGQTATLRLTFMAQEGLAYAHTLINILADRPTLQLGQTICDIGAIDISNSDWSGVGTWADLISGTTGRHIRFEFASPTAITKRDEGGGRFTSLYPEPLDVFSGLARRWQALDGPELPADLEHFLQSGGCVVANYRLHTVEFRTHERVQIGFMGSVVYECRKSEEQYIASLNALARLAFFAGMGYQTARGMGAVRTTISD